MLRRDGGGGAGFSEAGRDQAREINCMALKGPNALFQNTSHRHRDILINAPNEYSTPKNLFVQRSGAAKVSDSI